jgi:Cap4 dsDNA endonuclease
MEKGGVVARRGFTYQDHIAVSLCLDMVKAGSQIIEVWCESQDDITLIYQIGGDVVVEFVQVKTTDENNWTVATLCRRDKKEKAGTDNEGTSILERSLAYDRCIEKTLFRIVTTKDLDGDLKILKLPLGSPDRSGSSANMLGLHAKVKSRIKEWKSLGGHDCSYWIENAFWEVRGSIQAVKDGNFREIIRLSESFNINLKSFEVEIIYDVLLSKMRTAAEADAGIEPQSKKLSRGNTLEWMRTIIQDSTVPDNIFGNTNSFTVSWPDLREVIESIHPSLSSAHLASVQLGDFSFVEIEVKNDLNRLSEAFFKQLQRGYEPYFSIIERFLAAPENFEVSGMYFDIASELNMIIATYGGSVHKFDEILGQIYNGAISVEGEKLRSKKRLIWALIAFMYFSCDIGLKK